MNNLKQIDIKNRTYYFFDDINEIKTDEKSNKNVLIYHIRYVIIKGLSYATFNSVKCLYLITSEKNGYIEESNGNKYLTLFPAD